MKKLLSILLSLALVFGTISVLMSVPAAAAGPVTITAGAGGMVDKTSVESGTTATVTATPYYGNSFAGWFAGDTLVSPLSTYTGVIDKDLTAKFNVYNQIVDGSFESGTNAGADALGLFHTFTAKEVRPLVNPLNVNATHGANALYVTSDDETKNSVAYAVNVPVTVKKNTKYVFAYSYYIPTRSSADYSVRNTLQAELNYDNKPWEPNAVLPQWSMHWSVEAEDGTSPAPRTWAYRGNTNSNILADTHASVGAGPDKWVDVVFVFETGESDTIFAAGEDTANVWFTIGTARYGDSNGVDNSPNFYLDNLSFTEAATAAAEKLTVLAGTGGSVEVAEKLKYPSVVNYYTTAGEVKGDAVATHTVANSAAYANMLSTVKYTAKANEGYAFKGWYDNNDNLVSDKETYAFTSEGVYTAKFEATMGSTAGGYTVDNGNNTKTAYPYFGNIFDAWYNASNEVITRDTTVDTSVHTDAVARFFIHNQISDGDFSGGTNTTKLVGTGLTSEVMTEANGNKFVRLTGVTTANNFNAFSWPFTVEKGKKYIVSFKIREGLDAEGNKLSTSSLSFRKQIRPENTAGTSYDWKSLVFADQKLYTYGNLQNHHEDKQQPLCPSSGTALNYTPTEGSNTDHFGRYTQNPTDWVSYSYILDAATLSMDGNNLFASSNAVKVGLIIGQNAGTMVVDVDDIVVSEVKEEYGIGANSEGGNITLDRRASTVALPVTYTAYPNTDGNYQFEGWYDATITRVSIAKEYSPTSATTLTAKFKSEKLGFERVDGDNVTAYPYYGNKFDGWYEGKTLMSTKRTVTVAESANWTAKYKSGGNLLHDGGFEEVENTGAVYDAYTDYHAGSVKEVVPTYVPGSGPEFGKYCLQVTPKQETSNGKIKGLLNIPADVVAGTTYLWKFSYTYTTGTHDASRDYIYFSVDEAKADGGIPWSGGNVDYSFHAQKHSEEGLNLASWSWGRVRQVGAEHTTNNNFSATNEWVDMYVMFTPEKSGKHYLTIGTLAAQTNVVAFDNMSLTEVSLGKTPTSVTAEANGSVISYRADEPAYWSLYPRNDLNNDTVDKTGKVDLQNPYYVDFYASYFAQPALGYTFDGWYKEGIKYSEETELIVKTTGDGAYVAKFAMDENHYYANATIEAQNGAFGGYLTGKTSYTEILSGDSVTFTAVPYAGNTFMGWYDKSNGSLLSTDASFDCGVRKNMEVVAKFVINNKFTDSGYENTSSSDVLWGEGKEWDKEAGLSSAFVYSGNNSLNIFAPGTPVRHAAFTVNANATYHLSFYWKGSSATVKPEYIKVYNAADNSLLAENTEFSASADKLWQKAFVNFNTGAATSVIFEIKYAESLASIYLDELALFDTASADFTVSVDLQKEGDIFPGFITCDKVQSAGYGENVTVSVEGYEKNIFKGWYENGVLMSTDLSYSFTADSFAKLTAMFDVKNIYPDSGAEHIEKGVSLSHKYTDWFVSENQYNQWGFDVVASDAGDKAHTGSSIFNATHRTTNYGTTVKGLKEKTNYIFSFWWNFSQEGSFDICRIDGVQTGLELARGMGGTSDGTWQQVVVPFYSDQNTEIKLTFKYNAGSGSCMMDDFALYESNFVGVYAAEGGTVISDLNGGENGPAEDGQVVTVTATPNNGNTFKGWYNYKNLKEVLSTDLTYSFTVNGPKYVIAYFEGDDAEPMNYFVDGDFENNCFNGIEFTHSFYAVDWCTYTVVKSNHDKTFTPISGDKMLAVTAHSRNSNMLINNLTPNQDYTLSFYYNVDAGASFTAMSAIRFLDEAGQRIDEETKNTLVTHYMYNFGPTDYVNTNSLNVAVVNGANNGGEWRRVEMNFNAGNRGQILLHFTMGRPLGNGSIYFDDFRLVEGNTQTEDVANGDFSDAANVKGWQGDFTTSVEGTNAFGISNSEIHNSLFLDWAIATPYTVKFKAKSADGAKLGYGLSGAGAFSLYENGKHTATSNTSHGEIALTNEWKEYSFDATTNGLESYKLFFKSLNGKEFMIDDVVINKANTRIDVEKFTFEDDTENYIGVNASVKHAVNEFNHQFFAITSDEFKSGQNSLMMSAKNLNPGTDETADTYKDHRLAMDWSSILLLSGRRYEVSFWAKAENVGDEFVIQANGTDGSWEYVSMLNKTIVAENTEWNKYSFDFSIINLTNNPNEVDIVIGNSEHKNSGNIYFDDVLVAEALSAITGTADKLYTEDISQNYFSNPSFEKADALTDAYVKSGDAFYGDKYISVEAGDKVIIPVYTKPWFDITKWFGDYTFAASVRGDNSAEGYLGIAFSPDGTDLMTDADGNAYKMSVNTDGKWVRSGINFLENRWTYLYLVIECTKGTFDVDYVSMFNQLRSFKENPQLKDTTVKFNGYEDMATINKGNFIGGNLTNLPEGSKVVLLGDKTYVGDIDAATGRYDITNIANGTYTMMISAPDAEFMTVWGDLVVSDEGVSGLACERLSGETEKVEGAAVRNGIVKIVDEDTGYAYFTASNGQNEFTAYILYSWWYVEGTTKDPEALASFGINLSDFVYEAETKNAAPAVTTVTGESSPLNSDRSLPVALVLTVMLAATALIVLTAKKGECK